MLFVVIVVRCKNNGIFYIDGNVPITRGKCDDAGKEEHWQASVFE